jgi:hypothetical protein
MTFLNGFFWFLLSLTKETFKNPDLFPIPFVVHKLKFNLVDGLFPAGKQKKEIKNQLN